MLWNNRSTRESRLLAAMVYPREEFTAKKAEEWISDADTVELVDLLCFRLVRYIPEAEMLAKAYFLPWRCFQSLCGIALVDEFACFANAQRHRRGLPHGARGIGCKSGRDDWRVSPNHRRNRLASRVGQLEGFAIFHCR